MITANTTYSMEDLIYQGSQFKAFANLEPIGTLSMKDYDFEIDVYTEMSPRRLTFTKDKCTAVDDDTYFVVVDSTKLSPGYIKMRVRAKVPDNDVNGFRERLLFLRSASA